MGAKGEQKTNAPTYTHMNVYYFKHLLSFWLFYLFAFFTQIIDARKIKAVPYETKKNRLSKSIVEG